MNHIQLHQSKRKDRRVDSPAVAAASEAKATFKPVLVKGIGEGELIEVKPSMFARLDIDPAYQRGETSMVGTILRVLQAGGKVLDPVTLCHRKGDDKTLWVVDGYQRVCAHQETKLPFMAMLHQSEDAEAEHQFFIALNARRAVAPNVIAKAWVGPSGTAMRRANESPEHPLYDRVNFSQSQNETRIAASCLAKGMLCVVGFPRSGGRIDVIMSKTDTGMAKQMPKARVEHYLRLVGMVCPVGFLPALVLRALGTVAQERWITDIKMPNRKVIERLKTTQWASKVILVERYYPLLLDLVRKVWRA